MAAALGATGWCFLVEHVRGETYPIVPAVMNTIHRCWRGKVKVYTTMPTRVMTYTTRVVSLQAETKRLTYTFLTLIGPFVRSVIHSFYKYLSGTCSVFSPLLCAETSALIDE